MLKEFREFAIRGNVMDLAIAVIIGGALGKIVTSDEGMPAVLHNHTPQSHPLPELYVAALNRRSAGRVEKASEVSGTSNRILIDSQLIQKGVNDGIYD
jgi:hypothetical protein